MSHGFHCSRNFAGGPTVKQKDCETQTFRQSRFTASNTLLYFQDSSTPTKETSSKCDQKIWWTQNMAGDFLHEILLCTWFMSHWSLWLMSKPFLFLKTWFIEHSSNQLMNRWKMLCLFLDCLLKRRKMLGQKVEMLEGSNLGISMRWPSGMPSRPPPPPLELLLSNF